MVFAYSLTPAVFYFILRMLGTVTRVYDLIDEVNVLHQHSSRHPPALATEVVP